MVELCVPKSGFSSKLLAEALVCPVPFISSCVDSFKVYESFATRQLSLRGGRGLAPDPEDDSDIDSGWILPEEPTPRNTNDMPSDGLGSGGEDSDTYRTSSPTSDKASDC